MILRKTVYHIEYVLSDGYVVIFPIEALSVELAKSKATAYIKELYYYKPLEDSEHGQA